MYIQEYECISIQHLTERVGTLSFRREEIPQGGGQGRAAAQETAAVFGGSKSPEMSLFTWTQ